MTSDELKSWQAAMGLTAVAAAERIGVTRVTYFNYLGDKNRIPGMLGYACAAIANGMEPWPVCTWAKK
ncbi:MAG: hypothetical protein V4447_10830 [Pseudomonadota bacterium]